MQRKFRNQKVQYDTPTSDLYIPTVIDRVACGLHNMPLGVPCFHVQLNRNTQAIAPAICNNRAIKAGYVGRINPASLSRTQKNLKEKVK